MATSNNRDVKMTLSVETLGADDIKKLQTSVAQLAKEGGAAAPEFQALADEIGRLGDQGAALQAFQQLSAETNELVAKQEAAGKSAEEYKVKLDELRTSTLAATQAQAAAAAELADAKAAQLATRDSLAKLTAQTAEAKAADETYADQVSKLKLAKIDQRAEVERLTAAMSKANAAVAEAEAAETKLEGTYNRAAEAARVAGAAVEQQQTALKQSAEAAEALNVSTGNVAASQAQLLRALNDAGQAALSAQANVDKLIRAEEELAAQNAFEKQAADSKRLFDTASYAELFDEALRRVAASEREVAQAQAALDWQREAEAIVNATHATQELARQQEILLEVERQLAADKALEQQAAAAEKLADQEARLRLFTQVLDDIEAKERAAANAAQEAGDKIKSAFGQVGVTSVEQLKSEIAQVREAMDTLKNGAGLTGSALQQAFTSGNAKIKELEAAIRAANGEMTLADRTANLFKNSLGQIAAGNVIADGIGYLVNKVKELGREFVDVTMKTETMRKGLQAVYKDSTVAGQQFDFLRTTANASGVSIGSLNDAFLRFSAATKSANIPLSDTNALFAAVTRAGATLGLSGEQVAGTLDALGQMASKGTVSMEELRQQLGDRLPGALGLSAKGLGITEAQLIKLVESGKLATEDFFPALTKGLATMAGDTDTLTGAWQRFTNLLNEGAVALGDAGGLEALKLAVQGLAVVFGAVAVPIQGFVEVINLAARGIGVFWAKLTDKDGGKQALADFQVQVEKSANRISKFQDAIDKVTSSSKDHADQTAKTTVATAQSTSGVIQAAIAHEKLTASVGATGSAYVQKLVKTAEDAVATEAAINASEKLQKAKADEGKAIVLTAQLTGDASKVLDAQAIAAVQNAAASEQVVVARQREVAVTQSYVQSLLDEKAKTGELSSAKQQQLDKAQQLLTVQQAALEKDRESTFELGRQALAAQTASEAYADNSTKVTAYKQAMENSRAVAALLTDEVTKQKDALGELKDQLETGKITQEFYDQAKKNLLSTTAALNTATGDAAKFEALYKDSVNDSAAAVDRKARSAEADLQVSLAQVNASKAHFETLAKEAASLGDTTLATEFAIDAKRKEIEAIEISTRVKNLELDADKAAIEIQLSALDPQDRLYEQKKAELEIRLKIIEAKQIEANASQEVIKGINNEIDAIRRKQQQQNAPLGIVGPAPDNGRQNGNGTPGTSGSSTIGGGVGKASNQATNLTPVDKAFAVRRNGGEGMSIDDLKVAYEQAKASKAWLDDMVKAGGAGDISQAAWTSTQSLLTATKNALDKATQAEAVKAAATAAASAASAASAGSSGGTSHTVNITLPSGQSSTINAASAQDASNLAALLSQLGTAKKVS